MKQVLKSNNLPWLALVCGAAGLGLHRLLYVAAVDARGLLTAGHPVEILLWILTAAVLGLSAAAALKLEGKGDYAANFPKSVSAAAGHFIFAVCILLTVLLEPSAMAGAMGEIWRWLGLAAFAAMVWAGLCRLEGKKPSFVSHMVLCVFLAIQLITHYRTWSGDPQLQDYVFTLLGWVALVFFAYCHTAFDVGFCKRRLLLGTGLAAIYLCMAGLLDTPYTLLYVGGIFWVWSNFCVRDLPEESVA